MYRPSSFSGPFEADLVGGDVKCRLLQGGDDLGGADGAVEMAFVVGVGLDRDALLGERVGQLRAASARRAFSISCSLARCFSTIRLWWSVAIVARPCGSR